MGNYFLLVRESKSSIGGKVLPTLRGVRSVGGLGRRRRGMKREEKICKYCKWYVAETPMMEGECELGEDIELEGHCDLYEKKREDV